MNKHFTRTLALLLLIAGLITGFSSCTKYSFMRYDKKIMGQWTFEKVTHKSGFLQQSVNITRNYEGWTYDFKSDYTISAINSNTGERLTGYWRIDEYTDYYYDEDGVTSTSTNYVLRFNLDDGRLNTNYVWNIGSITGNYIRASEYVGNERWNYKMARVQ